MFGAERLGAVVAPALGLDLDLAGAVPEVLAETPACDGSESCLM